MLEIPLEMVRGGLFVWYDTFWIEKGSNLNLQGQKNEPIDYVKTSKEEAGLWGLMVRLTDGLQRGRIPPLPRGDRALIPIRRALIG